MSDCAHFEFEIRRRVLSNGVVAYWRQCLHCFQTVGTAIKRCDAPSDAPPFDERARDQYWDDWRQARDGRLISQRNAEQREWWDRYNAYLQSDEWQRKRELVFARDGKRCQARLDGCSIFANHVHHLTYDHVFNEPLFDLVAICQSCHDQLHEQ